jgi:hypothetical protein
MFSDTCIFVRHPAYLWIRRTGNVAKLFINNFNFYKYQHLFYYKCAYSSRRQTLNVKQLNAEHLLEFYIHRYIYIYMCV